jgi:hypothetical protein
MARRTDPFSAFYRGPHAITSRVVLLTGAAGGIGRVMTLALLRGGHCIRTHQNRSTKKKIEAACALPKSLIRLTPLPVKSQKPTPTWASWLAVASNMLPESESLPRSSAIRIIVVSTTHERIIEPLVQGSRATRDGVNEIILPLRCVCN